MFRTSEGRVRGVEGASQPFITKMIRERVALGHLQPISFSPDRVLISGNLLIRCNALLPKRVRKMNTIDQLKVFFDQEIFKGKVPESFDAEYELLDSGVLSSVVIVELVSHLEQKYGVNINFDDVIPENFGNLNALSRFIDSKLSS